MRPKLLLLCSILTTLLSCVAQPSPGNAQQPNILVIMVDDMSDRLSTVEMMPNLQYTIAQRGVRFTNMFANFPQCASSRATFLTGQLPQNHGVRSNGPPTGGYGNLLPTANNTLPVWLQQAGYATMHSGKYINGYGDGTTTSTTHVPPGWTQWEGMPDALGAYNYYNYSINVNGTLVPYGNAETDYKTDVQAQRTINWIATQTGPWFVSLNFLAPHNGDGTVYPTPPARWLDAYSGHPSPRGPAYDETNITDKPAALAAQPALTQANKDDISLRWARGRESLMAVDDAIGALVAYLKDTNTLTNTLIIFTSDNGLMYGDHRLIDRKMVPYEASIRIPLFVRGPGIPIGEQRTQLVSMSDLPPTIALWALAVPGRLQDGMPLQPLITNASAPWRSAFYVEGLSSYNGVSYGTYAALRSAGYVLAEHTSGEGELYDFAADPYQLRNVYYDSAYAATKAALASQLNVLKTCAGPTCWVP